MPIKIPDHLPAVDVLHRENIFVMTQGRAVTQISALCRSCW